MKSVRLEKISEQLRRELSVLIQQEFSETYGVITITRVYITPDIKVSKVYFSCLDKIQENDVLMSLNKKARYFQSIIGRKLKIKFTPVISFQIDDYQGDIDNVEKLLQEINHGA